MPNQLIEKAFEGFPDKDRWRLFVDGQYQRESTGLQEYESREPGCIAAMYRAFEFLRNNLEKPLSIEKIKEYHRLALSNIALQKYNLRGRELVTPGELRSGAVHFGDFSQVTDKRREHLNALIEKFNIASFVQTQNFYSKPTFAIQTKAAEKDQNASVIHEILLSHEESLKQLDMTVKEDREKALESILETVQALEVLHPFYDGNCRIFCMLILNELLIKNGFKPAIFEDPNCFDIFTLDELKRELEKGFENFQKLKSEPCEYTMHFAVTLPDTSLLEELLMKEGSSRVINVTDELGNTPLIYAIAAKQEKAIQLLETNGADKTTKCLWGTPETFAKEWEGSLSGSSLPCSWKKAIQEYIPPFCAKDLVIMRILDELHDDMEEEDFQEDPVSRLRTLTEFLQLYRSLSDNCYPHIKKFKDDAERQLKDCIESFVLTDITKILPTFGYDKLLKILNPESRTSSDKKKDLDDFIRQIPYEKRKILSLAILATDKGKGTSVSRDILKFCKRDQQLDPQDFFRALFTEQPFLTSKVFNSYSLILDFIDQYPSLKESFIETFLSPEAIKEAFDKNYLFKIIEELSESQKNRFIDAINDDLLADSKEKILDAYNQKHSSYGKTGPSM